MGVVPPADGFLELPARAGRRDGALLIFDEVITGFRVARGGAQELYGITPDLTLMGKVLGGGLPAAAYGGRRELMERVAPAGDVYQAGTLSGNPLAVAAGLATLERLDGAAYRRLGDLTDLLATGLRAAAGDRPVQVASAPGLVTPFFSAGADPRLRRRRRRATSRPTAASAGRCSSAASTPRRPSSRPGSSPSPTTRRRSTAPRGGHGCP